MDKNSKIILRDGNQIPTIGLGTWLLTYHTAETVAYAFKLGYRLIDTSSDYETQPGIGEAIKVSGLSRKDLYISTKVEESDDAYERTKSNLRELGLDYIDLELIHRPPALGAGEGLWRSLMRAKEEGLVRSIGVSNYSIELMNELIEETGEIPAVNQIEWSPFGYSDIMKDYCNDRGIIIQAYSPLTRGTRLKDEELNGMASKYGKSPAQILIRWSIQKGTVPIPKANQSFHLEENIDVFDFEISDEDMEVLNDFNEEYSALGSLAYV